ncbi:hypothetical protein O181_020589 [Austropuccinia psidii MF-1]|uniref:Integrase zinc-binding domain-containing protein n=1 Tax=Austropuccinia psidii MF-1 TaxID=1389203 RepID=A0A9Q3CBJ7_9BASI|nr:hypothetical protein [Austropuccinia psidii MF-1]
MTIVHKYGNIHKNADGLNKWELPNTPEKTSHVPENAEPQIPIEVINITKLGTEFSEEVRESYNYLDDIWRISYDNGRFHLLVGILYHMSKHTCIMVLHSIMLIDTISIECHDTIYYGNLSEERKMERIKTCAWWKCWRKDFIRYCHSCDRCQKANKATGKRFGFIIHIQKPSTPWEVVHMDWVAALPPGCERSYNECIVIVDRYRKTPIFLPCPKYFTAMDTAL